ncbi:hypothetical protein SG34_028790 [Thalassomonas viridans]|uniref:Ankyrin n=1 Tax=Thalassomonas viridans TaxID=137584 RepID=A0AAE9Z374_9GAMM|nr:hypothetical protein [Thalassomonas viridans]WDE05240.1 hypothetical protein SG34_028790 [Thalassomonas viridans]
MKKFLIFIVIASVVLLIFYNTKSFKSDDSVENKYDFQQVVDLPNESVEIRKQDNLIKNDADIVVMSSGQFSSESDFNIEQKELYLKRLKDELKKQALENRKQVTEQSLSADEMEKMTAQMTGLFKTAANHEWDNFVETITPLEDIDPKVLDLALLQAITNNAPFEIIEQLLNKGAQFSPGIIHSLALKNNVKLTKRLLPLGLNLHEIDHLGRNAVSYTLMAFQSREMFNFLLTHGVSVKPSRYGPDPLDASLKYSVKNDAVYYVQKLIGYGAPIEKSHYQLVDQIKHNNVLVYNQLKEIVPELF